MQNSGKNKLQGKLEYYRCVELWATAQNDNMFQMQSKRLLKIKSASVFAMLFFWIIQWRCKWTIKCSTYTKPETETITTIKRRWMQRRRKNNNDMSSFIGLSPMKEKVFLWRFNFNKFIIYFRHNGFCMPVCSIIGLTAHARRTAQASLLSCCAFNCDYYVE